VDNFTLDIARVCSYYPATMGIQWYQLTPEEKRRFDDYDIKLVSLLSERIRNPHDGAEKKIKQLHSDIELFIEELEKKYSG
jgi:hypothetical protein